MILALDAGNTRIKWGLHDGSAWQEKGWVATADAMRLGDLWKDLATPASIVASNVAGANRHQNKRSLQALAC